MRILSTLKSFFAHARQAMEPKKLQGAIDRFEGNYAVIDFGGERAPMNVLKSKLPRGVKEGQWLDLEMRGNNLVKATVNQAKTDAMAEEIKKLTQDLFE